jgi:DNA-binding NarL/FixJ family response regulator
MSRPTVLLADDHEIVLEGLHRVLEPEFEIVGSVHDGAALVKAAEKLRPDLVVADVTMPMMNGIEATRKIKKSLPRTTVVILTMHPDVMYATEALDAGAKGYVLKDAIRSELLKALSNALKGEIYVSEKIAPQVMQALAEGTYRHKSATVKLTARQREVLQLVAEGHTISDMARILYVSRRTVEFHKYNIMQALGLRSTAELTQYAIKHGIVAV